MTVSEPQDGNVIDLDDGFMGGCGFFELLFTACLLMQKLTNISTDEDLRLDKGHTLMMNLFFFFVNLVKLPFLFLREAVRPIITSVHA